MSRARLRSVAVAVLLVALVVATGTRAGAKPSPAETERDLDEQLQILNVEETDDEVVLEVALPTAFGRLAPLDRNFGVTDGGRLVDIDVAPLDTPSTVLVIDTSGSMQGPSLAAAKAAARGFVEASPSDAQVGLVSFGQTVVVHQEPTLDRSGLGAAIDRLDSADGETALWDGLVAAADLIDGSGERGATVVVLSDGGDTVSSATRSDAIDRLSSQSAVLYAVGIESPETDRAALEETVEQVGGQFLAATDVGDLDFLYTDIAGRLASRYRLAFTPAHRGARTVVVSVVADGKVATTQLTLSGGPTGPAPGQDQAPAPDVEDLPVLGPATVPAPGPVSGPAMLWGGAGSMFAALALVGLVVSRPQAQVRLVTATGADHLAGIKAQLGQAVERLITRHDRERRLDARLDAADVHLRPGEFILFWLLGTSLVGLAVTAITGPLVGVLVIPMSAAGANLVLGARASRRRSRFADQLTETLGIMASSLRAGQSLPRAIELVAAEAPEPTAQQFQRIYFEVRVGRDLTESIRGVAGRMKSDDLEWLAQAVDIHRELGGDLTEILANLAGTIRERRTVARQIDALSAEGRATGWLLLAMPVVLFFFSWWRTPASVGVMFAEPLGRLLLVAAVVGMVVGHVWIRQLVKLKY